MNSAQDGRQARRNRALAQERIEEVDDRLQGVAERIRCRLCADPSGQRARPSALSRDGGLQLEAAVQT